MDASSTGTDTTQREFSRGLAYGLLVVTTLLFACGVVTVRGVHESVPPIGLTFWRWGIAAMGLVPFVLPRLNRDGPAMLRHWRYFTIMGLCMVGGSALSAVALSFTTATNVGLVNASQPAITAVVAWLVARIRIGRLQSFGVAVAAFGIMVMVSRADLGVLLGLSFNLGDLVMIITVVCYAFYAVGLSKLPRDVSFPGAVFAILLLGSLALLPFYAVESLFYKPVPMKWDTFGVLAFLGLATSLIPVFAWSRAVPVVGANNAAIFVNLMPLFTAALAYFLLGEQLYRYHLVGALLIFAGIVLVVRAKGSYQRR